VGHQVLIGYSFWGFLGLGVRDTPDGGRSHRRTLVDGLRTRGHDIVFLQANRDLSEAGQDLTSCYRWDSGLPQLEALFLEWRWPIAGRNTTACGASGHTCDLHRQQQLLDHYATTGIPLLVWDKDRQLDPNHSLRRADNVVVCEPALHPSPGAVSLLFPVSDDAVDTADPSLLTAVDRDLPLVYIGNQYDRDNAFDRYFAPAAQVHTHLIAGKWPHTGRWPDLTFHGRIAFADVEPLYRRSQATVLLLPDRYARAGQVTQRLFEAVLAGCLPLTPTSIRSAARFTPTDLHVTDGHHAARKVEELSATAHGQRTMRLRGCLDRLNTFRLSRQLDVIDHALINAFPHQVGR
jgi:hypothetical protein